MFWAIQTGCYSLPHYIYAFRVQILWISLSTLLAMIWCIAALPSSSSNVPSSRLSRIHSHMTRRRRFGLSYIQDLCPVVLILWLTLMYALWASDDAWHPGGQRQHESTLDHPSQQSCHHSLRSERKAPRSYRAWDQKNEFPRENRESYCLVIVASCFDFAVMSFLRALSGVSR